MDYVLQCLFMVLVDRFVGLVIASAQICAIDGRQGLFRQKGLSRCSNLHT